MPVDTGGAALGRFDVRIALPSAHPVRVAAGVPAHVTLDFDLDSSNTVDLAATPPTVTVEPFLTVVPALETDREHRVRGLLVSADAVSGAVTVKVRPFRHRHGEFGRVRFLADDDTTYEIDGVEYEGQSGLDQLATLALDTPLIAQGGVVDRVLTADVILAGSSVPWAGTDAVAGVVTARDRDRLTVRAARFHARTGDVAIRRTIDVLVGPDTGVTAGRMSADPLDHLAISVGSRIVAFGAVVGTLADGGTFDASNGRVRLLTNSLTGEVAAAEPLAVELFRLNGLNPGVFDFSGTGTAVGTDADPRNYEIDTGGLDLATIAAGDLVRVRGLVAHFGAAPDDFVARTVIDADLEDNAAALVVSWAHQQGTTTPFAAVAPSRIDVDLSQARDWLAVRGVPRALIGDLDTIALVAGESTGVYGVVVRGSRDVQLYRDFDELTRQATSLLDSGHRMTRIDARGRYNALTEEMMIGRGRFEFVAP
ncbi:MAG: hypothetical protein HC809_07345 [Gammaproteobacteria bacterium]|nr:hypothetical protein [Gammaproteobacteria bacterium]